MLVGVESPEEAKTHQGGELPRVLNLEKERSEHFKGNYLKQVQHCTNLLCHITFPAHTEQVKTGPRLR